MDQKWFISNLFCVLCFLNISSCFYVNSDTFLHSGNARFSDIWDVKKREGLNQILPEDNWKEYEKPNDSLIEQPVGEERNGSSKLINVLAYDKLYNLTEKDKGPENETKVIFVNSQDHLRIYENLEDEDDEAENQLQEGEKNIFHLLSPEGFLSRIVSEDQSKALERTKRQAEEGKKKCKCRRKGGKKTMRRRRRRRRRRRNRIGQRPARGRRRRRGRRRQRGGRRGGRRGRRRCVCRPGGGEGGGGEGKDGEEEPEVEQADGEGGEEGEGEGVTTEGGEENATEEGEAEEGGEEEEGGGEEEGDGGGEEGEGEGEEGEGEGEGDDDGGDDDEDWDEGSDEESDEKDGKGKEMDIPTIPGGSMPSASAPTYFIPYPNMVETPIAMMPSGGMPMYTIPTYPTVKALVSGKIISKKEE